MNNENRQKPLYMGFFKQLQRSTAVFRLNRPVKNIHLRFTTFHAIMSAPTFGCDGRDVRVN
jgi:hypothetical protein